MQTCFFAISGVLPLEEALRRLKEAIAQVLREARLGGCGAQRGRDLGTTRQPGPSAGSGDVTADHQLRPPVPAGAPEFVQRVTARMLAGEGDLLPVSALPVDGAFPTGTAAYEKRTIATEIPIWEPDLCIDCGKCAIVCPHAAIRMKVYDPDENPEAADRAGPRASATANVPGLAADHPGGARRLHRLRCLRQPACPAFDKCEVQRKSINMRPIGEHLEVERERFDTFLTLTPADTAALVPGHR